MGGAWAAQAKERPPSAQSTKRRQKWSNNPYVHELAYAIPKGIAIAPPPLLLCFAAAHFSASSIHAEPVKMPT